jgi:deazaflavin-dependent oxidoreductase (nitroreductase family)
VEDDLVAWGRYLRLETRGRRSGDAASAVVGFVERPDGSLIVAAGSPDAHWALNLLHDPRAQATVGKRTIGVLARALEGAEHAAAIRELILRYVTPAETLGSGPAFALVPGPMPEPAG